MSRATTSISRMVRMVVVVEVAWQLNGWTTVLYLRDNLSSFTQSLGKRLRGNDNIGIVFRVLVVT